MNARKRHASGQPPVRRLLASRRDSPLRWGVGKIENHPVILNRAAVKDPVNRIFSVTIRDPSLALRMTGWFWCGLTVYRRVGCSRRIWSQCVAERAANRIKGIDPGYPFYGWF